MARIALLLAFLGMLGTAAAESALQWDRKTVEASLAPGEKTLRAEFGFVNTSQAPVTIDSVKSSCGCTTAGLEKKVYQPGEHGRITAVFTPGSRKGTQVKGIRVAVRGEREPIILTLVSHIGPALQIAPSLVFWRAGDAPRPKTLRVTVPAEMGLRVNRVTSNDPRMDAVLEPDKGGGYHVTVTPKATDRPITAVLTLQAVTREGEAKAFQAYAQVK
ncbi:MAG: DUF1573 domain-containing protein [Chthoniobacteraceae bacterium]|nr:DUF1573 domain-containing protein [Chthoniobacteraceae bacterium]